LTTSSFAFHSLKSIRRESWEEGSLIKRPLAGATEGSKQLISGEYII